MKRILVAWLIVFLSSADAYALKVGDSENDVVAALGKPNVARKMPDGALVWRFKDGTTVRLENGVVRELDGPSAVKTPAQQNPATSAASEGRPVQVQKAKATSPPALAAPTGVANSSIGMEGKINSLRAEIPRGTSHPHGSQYLGFALLGLGILVGLACNIMFAVVAFRESMWWLLGCLFVPFVSLIFCITHWDETKKIIGWNLLVAVPLIVGGIFMSR